MRQSPDITSIEMPEDSLGNIPWEYASLRKKLLDIGYLVLPHPNMGFGTLEDEEKAIRTLEWIRNRAMNIL